MHSQLITPLALTAVVAILVSGCDQQDLDCQHPITQEQRQQCAPQRSKESRIAPTEKPKNWLDLTNPKR